MSAYIVEKNHIQYIMAAVQSPTIRFDFTYKDQSGNWVTVAKGDFDATAKLGNILWQANAAGVNARRLFKSSLANLKSPSQKFTGKTEKSTVKSPSPKMKSPPPNLNRKARKAKVHRITKDKSATGHRRLTCACGADFTMNTQATISRRANEFPASGQTYDETAHTATAPAILVISNGSQWYGQEPATVGELLELLKTEPLDQTFEDYGNFADACSVSYKDGLPLLPAGWWSFWGNFYTLSHVFHIVTNDAEAIQDLRQAILANQASPGYKQAREAIQKRAKQFAPVRVFQLPKAKLPSAFQRLQNCRQGLTALPAFRFSSLRKKVETFATKSLHKSQTHAKVALSLELIQCPGVKPGNKKGNR